MKLQLWPRSNNRSSKRIHAKPKLKNAANQASAAQTRHSGDSIRVKETDIGTVLPPGFELLGDRPGILRYTDLDGNELSLDYKQVVKKDRMPIPMPVDREHYGTLENSPYYWATGYADWLNVNEAVKRYTQLDQQDTKTRVLDFGCASGRFLRNCCVFGADNFDSWGCDFAPAHVDWVKRHLSDQIKIVLTTNTPHLPFPDGYFDVVTAFSVFTHIDHLEDAWLLELRRVTQPNGLLYLTVHNQATWDRVLAHPTSLKNLLLTNNVEGNATVTRELFESPMPKDRMVFRISPDDIYNCDVWITNEYVHQKWGRYFDIHQIADNGHTSYQSPVIMRPRS